MQRMTVSTHIEHDHRAVLTTRTQTSVPPYTNMYGSKRVYTQQRDLA